MKHILKDLNDNVKVFINGAWLGISEDPYTLYLNLKNNAQEILQSIKPPDLNFYQIGLEINNPKNNFKELINPLPNWYKLVYNFTCQK